MRFAVDPCRCITGPAPDVVEGALKAGGLIKLWCVGVRAGAGVFGNSPGVGRKGVTGGNDIFEDRVRRLSSLYCMKAVQVLGAM